MAFDGDPYRTLGLVRGASIDEVKRAYRRLAKANHPDAAGSGALPRFLAIQAAYEHLVGGSAGAGAKPRGTSSASRPPSEADTGRAEATRRAYGGRARGRRTTDEAAGRGRTADATPGQSGAGPAGPGPAGAGPAGTGPAARERPAGAHGERPADPDAGRRRGKATLGSTSYDDADAGPVEPDWSGASWYGTTSGTYWTINPKEYADPRKHGPEYQARARRASGGRPEMPADGPEPTTARDPEVHETASRRSKPGSSQATGSRRDSTSGPSEGHDDRATRDARWRPVGEQPQVTDSSVPDPARALANLARALTDPRTGGLRGRVVRAFLGWLPIALGIGWLLGELTGCGRFAATCDPSVNPLIVLIQGAALVALLLLPLVASLAASAALGSIVAAVAAAAILSATGAAADEGSRRATLGLLLVAAWLAGLAMAILQRFRSTSARVGPVS